MMDQPISIVVPCFNEENNINDFFDRVSALNINAELLFIDDGSTDSTWNKINDLLDEFKRVHVVGIRFTKNFGKEAAIEAGLEKCTGDLIVTIDSDLQHPIELIPEMVNLWNRNKDVHIINAVKINRQKESIIMRFMVTVYYALFKLCTGIKLENHSDFKLMDRKVLTAYVALNEKNKFYRGLTNWLGFNAIDLVFEPKLRQEGKKSWSTLSLFKYAKSSILSFSYIPLKVISFLGALSIIFSVVLMVDTIIKKINGSSAEGFPTVILLQLGMGSVLLFSIGILAEYLAEIYKEIKQRPMYIIDKEYREKDE